MQVKKNIESGRHFSDKKNLQGVNIIDKGGSRYVEYIGTWIEQQCESDYGMGELIKLF